MKKIIKKIAIKIITFLELHKSINIMIQNIKMDFHSVAEYGNVSFYGTSRVINLLRSSKNIKIGDNTHIRGELLIHAYGGEIKIGENCYIGENSRIWSGAKVEIGNDVLISHNVNIIDTDSHEIDSIERSIGYRKIISEGHPTNQGNVVTKPIVIKNHAWISFNAIILKGVTIGEGAIIAAGAVVTKDVAPYTLVAGNPAIFIKNLEQK